MNDTAAQLIRLLGYLLLATAAVVLSVALLTLYQVFFSPDSVAAVQVVKDFLAADVPLLMTEIRGQESRVDLDPSARMVIVFFIGAMTIIALTSMVRALVALGLQIVKFSLAKNDAGSTQQ
ncbi:MAG: hypothetical protein AAFN50_04410 [Pseudomonadota bacterium]